MEKLKAAIERYLSADTKSKKSSAKGAITRIINERSLTVAAPTMRAEFWSVAVQFDSDVDLGWLKQRFTVGSFFQEGEKIFGWWDDGSAQVQAEQLPLYHRAWSDELPHVLSSKYYVSFYRCPNEIHLWKERGFYQAEELPIALHWYEKQVKFDVNRSGFWVKYGYALPCELPWSRYDDCLMVKRSIISAGWWSAYKWWPGCCWWYYGKHPEWFADLEWWGTYNPTPQPQRFEPPDDPYALVLGGQSQ